MEAVHEVALHGPHGSRTHVKLSQCPARVEYLDVIYYRVDDPDTGELLCYLSEY